MSLKRFFTTDLPELSRLTTNNISELLERADGEYFVTLNEGVVHDIMLEIDSLSERNLEVIVQNIFTHALKTVNTTPSSFINLLSHFQTALSATSELVFSSDPWGCQKPSPLNEDPTVWRKYLLSFYKTNPQLTVFFSEIRIFDRSYKNAKKVEHSSRFMGEDGILDENCLIPFYYIEAPTNLFLADESLLKWRKEVGREDGNSQSSN